MPLDEDIRQIVRDELERAEARLARLFRSHLASNAPEYLTTAAAGRLVSRAPKTIRKWVHEGHLRRYGSGKRQLVSRDELLAFVQGQQRSTAEHEAERLAGRGHG